MLDMLATLFEVGFFAAVIRIATPLILATLGEVITERSGVLNLGIEGIMLLGAMVGFTTAYFTGSLWLGVLAAVLVGVLAGLVMALLAVVFGVSQHVSGIGMTLHSTPATNPMGCRVAGQKRPLDPSPPQTTCQSAVG